MDINHDYTTGDHEARDKDVYALAKYKWTIKRLKNEGPETSSLIANIGCGAGTFTGMLASAGYRVTAFEPDPTAFAIAEKRVPPGCSISTQGLFEIEGKERFNVVVMHDVLEHIEDDRQAVMKLSELMRPGGLLLLSVPALQSLFGRHDEQLGHFRRYSKKSLTKVLGEGLEVIDVRYFGMASIPIVWLFSKRLRRDYPNISTDRVSLAQRLYGALCDAEAQIREPVGTALLAVARKRN
jgi:2-polyprenyl-3-methyl-5-hydroxy-6-metoxy-1,4-benzoquinol methylase